VSKPIQLPTHLTGYTRLKDKSVTLKFATTYEVTNTDLAEIDKYHGQEGWLLFKPNEFSEDEVPKDDAPSDLKSPSLRLRDVLYVYFMKTHDDASQFSNFYNAALEKYITQVKEKLD
jgi:hypothetical protein